MKTTHADLFPETLLVSHRGCRIYTTSLKVAEFSKKRHKDVLKAIENKLKVLPASFRERNFALTMRQVPGPKGAVRQEKMYEMTEEGFALTMMGFTGKEAVQWQVNFIEAFTAQRAALMQMTQREADGLYKVRPRWKPIVRNPLMSRKELIELTGHTSVGSITACRKRIRDAGVAA